MRLIPAIDLRGGRCVRLLQGRFDAETVYADDPLTVLEQYRELGARYLHVVDLDGARDGSQANRGVVAALLRAQAGLEIQLGGGVRSQAIACAWLEAGVRRIVVGSVAVTQPEAVLGWMASSDRDDFVLAFDVRLDAGGTPRLTTHGWESQSGASLWELTELYAKHGARHILCTDVARDGALTGPNVALYADAVRRFPSIRWQASGGVSCSADLHALAGTGVAAVISGRALLEARIPAEELEPFLRVA
jgi:phosphoribosylformimino-5-aminoimidazole carboxamide ribotide isomerase